MRPGAYQVQVDLCNRLSMSDYYVIVLVTCKEFSDSIIDKEVLSSLYDNRGMVGLI